MCLSGVPWWVCSSIAPFGLTARLGKLTLLTRYLAWAITS